MKASKMPQRVKALAAKPNDLSSTPELHMVGGSDLHMHNIACTHGPQINKINIILKHSGQ